MKRFLLALGVGTTLMMGACSSEHAATPKQPEVAREVRVLETAPAKVPDQVVALGTVHASETAELAAQMMGNVTAVHVREGDAVKRGQVLAVIDPSGAQAGLERAQAALSAARHERTAAQSQRTLAQSTLKRYATLFERKSVSPQEYDEVAARSAAAEARAEAAAASEAQAKAAVAQAQTAFGHTRIRAPFDGVVTARKVDPGAMAAPGTPLLTVEGTGRHRVDVTVDESSLRFVKLGAHVPVLLDAYPGERLEGRVRQIVPAADPASRTFLVKIELPRSPVLRSGLSARARFSRGEREALLVPRTAVVDRGALKGVFVVGQDHVAALRYVTVGGAMGDRVEVLSGLGPREIIVQAPAERELGGKRIEVQR